MIRPVQLVMGVLAVVLLLTAGCGPAPLPAPPTVLPTPTPAPPPADEVALSFLQAWQRGDYPAMYSQLSPATQTWYTEDQFSAAYEQTFEDAMVQGVTPRILAAYQPDTHAEVAFSVTLHTALFGDFKVRNQMPLSFVEGRWGVDWSPALVLPQLGDGAHVRLSTSTPSRGNIYDREGFGLAVQGELVEVGIVPGQMEDETEALDRLGAILQESPTGLQARYASANPEWYIPLGQISVEAAQTSYDVLNSIPGIELRTAWARSYREEQIAPHIVGVVGPIPSEDVAWWQEQGYSGNETVGWMGLERWGEPYLAGERGSRLEIVNAQGQAVALLAENPPRESSSLYTTFDRDFQAEVQDILGERTGAVAVLEADTGRVLALATYPTFDPNLFSTGISGQQWLDLNQDPHRPLVNRATQGSYPPGSVFKVVTMAAGLDRGGLDPDSRFTCEGTWTGLGQDVPKPCWLLSGHGSIPLTKALRVSCDITFYQVGLVLDGQDPMALPTYARDFGLGTRTGIQVEEEAGLVPDPPWKMQAKGEGWAPGDSVNLAIGQSELLATPLQVATMMAAVGNGGTLYRPSVVEMVASDPDSPDWVFTPTAVAQIPLGKGDLAAIQDSLHAATSVQDGTAYEALRGTSLPVAGKTGTAESGAEEPHAWFAGYAPAGDPEIAIAVILEYGGAGGENAAPIFRQVVEAYFRASPTLGAAFPVPDAEASATQ